MLEEKDKIEATSVQIGRVKSRISGKTRQNAELTTSMTEESAGEHSGYRISPKVHHSPIKCDKDIVVLLEVRCLFFCANKLPSCKH